MDQNTHIYNLPLQPTPFVGREPEIAEIVQLLGDEDCRLLSLVGPGGIGKTRLSVESIIRLSADTFEHGIYYVPLSQLTTAENIVSTIIGVLGIYIPEEGTPQEELLTFLSRRNLLLVMDNFEHVLEGANIVADILTTAPNVKILVTSRESLNLRMERVWHVRGMRFPDTEQLDSIDTYSALKLFVDRATWVRREFSVEAELACAIQICQLVGGMPLALELAASWMKVLTCAEIIAEIQRNVDFLASNVRNIPERHRSIRAVFDHSWHLCDDTEQTVFRRLCVFRGGFTREAAETIVGASLITLSNLVDKSILQKLPSGRYKLHRLSRQFADEKLELADETTRLHDAHMRYFADFMGEHAIDIKGRRQLEGLDEIEAEFFNINKAWDRAVEQADYGMVDQMMEGLALFCDMRSQYQIAEDLFKQALNDLSLTNSDGVHPVFNRLRIRYVQVWILQERFPIPERIYQLVEDCLAIATESDDMTTIMLCYWSSGELGRIQNDEDRSLTNYEQGQSIARELEAHYYVGRNLRGIDYENTVGNIAASEIVLEIASQHQALTREMNDTNGLLHALLYQSIRNISRGHSDENEETLLEIIDGFRMIQDTKSVGAVNQMLGYTSYLGGNFEIAEAHFIEAGQLQARMNFLSNLPLIYSQLAQIASLQAECDTALKHIRQVNTYSKKWQYNIQLSIALYGVCISDFERARTHLQNIIALHGILLNDQANQILSVSTFLLNSDDEKLPAVELLGSAYAVPENSRGWMEKWQYLNQLRADLETELGTEAYQKAWERGANRDLDTTMAELIAYFGDDEPDTTVPLAQPLAEPLTERELEVLELLAQGLTNPQIADQLYLSVGTVKVHTRNIYGKLNVSNRTEAATTARQLKLIT